MNDKKLWEFIIQFLSYVYLTGAQRTRVGRSFDTKHVSGSGLFGT